MRPFEKTMGSRRLSTIMIFAILLFALLLRIWPLSFPVDVNPDEEVVITRSLLMGHDGLNPNWFKYPPLLLYLVFASFGARYLMQRALGSVQSPMGFAEQYFADPLSFFIQGRLITVFLSVLSVWAIYCLARRLVQTHRSGLIAAFILAVSPLVVKLSHFAITDTPLLLPFILSLNFAAKYLESNSEINLVWAGLFAGFATAVKYPAGAAVFGVITAAILGRPGQGLANAAKTAAKGLTGFAAGFLIVCPWAVLDFQQFWYYMVLLADVLPESVHNPETPIGFMPYLIDYLPQGLGLSFYPLGILGLLGWMRKDWRSVAVVGMPALVFWVLMGSTKNHLPRYCLPILPLFILSSAWLLSRVCEHFKSGVHITVGLLFVLSLQPLFVVAKYNIKMSMDDTQTLATRWIERNIPSHSKILSESHGPRLAMAPERARKIRQSLPEDYEGRGGKYIFFEMHPPDDRPVYDWIQINLYEKTEGVSAYDTTWYRPDRVKKENIEFVIMSSAVYSRFQGKPEDFPIQNEFYGWIQKEWKKVAQFSSETMPASGLRNDLIRRPGPTLLIYQRPEQLGKI